MSATHEAWAVGHVAANLPPQLPRRRHLHRSDFAWAIAFVVPYAALFVAFVLYPMAYGLRMASSPALYAELWSDPRYLRAAVNTALFVGFAVNLQMVLALLLSGFFARRRLWIKVLLVFFILPWTVPAVPAYLSFHWMLVAYPAGLIDNLLSALFGIAGPFWFKTGWLALICDIVADVWKWLPLWTVVLLGGRMAIPQDLYDAAQVDGASRYRRFVHITLPLLANLYVISTLIAAIWAVGDYTPVLFVSDGAPAFHSEVLSTMGAHYWLDIANPPLGVAAGLTALPVLVVLTILLLRRLRAREVTL
jgi:multiple sugar transport system permease protein